MVQPLWRTVRRFLKKIKTELPYDSVIPFLGIYPEKDMIQKDTCIPVFTAALFTIAKTWKQPKCPLIQGNGEGCGAYIKWNITQPLKRMEQNHLQKHG